MSTAECGACGFHFKVEEDGNLREHKANKFWCPGGGKPPQPYQSPGTRLSWR